MFANCVDWRKTVAGVGIDQLYKNLDPYDVKDSHASSAVNADRLILNSTQGGKTCSSTGLCFSTRYNSILSLSSA